jgi:hypothetical protein
MQESVGLLDVVRVHNETFLEVLTTVRDLDEVTDLTAAASTLLIDLVASFEVAQRGFMDVRREPPAPRGDADA